MKLLMLFLTYFRICFWRVWNFIYDLIIEPLPVRLRKDINSIIIFVIRGDVFRSIC